ncbi:carboxypeptidase-like regulatory domain-containing protein [Aurantibacillus circumpalustris]|uniref:carboxypeptidase-like regulatory domain-containing protein n=1 Tax=Aurantibacillus circumpalustris TaxID=3036359 RepID=UPI00295AB714|nr:carboxypeptidase-like regulatory domain-containing protein [Aurantibacillus circumpalustris]
MFINIVLTAKFIQLKFSRLILVLFCLSASYSKAQQILKGIVFENDSITPLPFAYIINKSNGNGTMTDNDGHFTLTTNSDDTLICSYIGFVKLIIPIKKIAKNAKGEAKLFITRISINLGVVNITTFRFETYEREYMSDIIDRSRIKNINYFSSPISALYMRFSKEGKQIQKLAKIFEDILIEEEVQRKLSREILVRLTGDENIDYFAFRKYCYYVNDYYISSHEGAELYSKVMDCYKNWKAERGGYRKREENSPPVKRDPDANWKKREELKETDK